MFFLGIEIREFFISFENGISVFTAFSSKDSCEDDVETFGGEVCQVLEAEPVIDRLRRLENALDLCLRQRDHVIKKHLSPETARHTIDARNKEIAGMLGDIKDEGH